MYWKFRLKAKGAQIWFIFPHETENSVNSTNHMEPDLSSSDLGHFHMYS